MEYFERISKIQDARQTCSTPCMDSYFNGTAKFCGGPNLHYTLYQSFDLATSGPGTLDPFRKVWYMAVAMNTWIEEDFKERPWKTDYGTGDRNYVWHLHASSAITGEPLFPYNLNLDLPLYGLQY